MNRLVERNYLEINSLNELIETIPPSKNIKLELLNPPDFNLSKFFYKQIGKKYHWVDRLDWSDNAWIKYTENKNVKTYILKLHYEENGWHFTHTVPILVLPSLSLSLSWGYGR